MDRHTWNSGFLPKVTVGLIWIFCAFPFAPARADEYQDAITKAFPGFQIMSRSEFKPEIQKAVKGNPGLITGRFNDDDLMDFAAIIREKAIRPREQGVREHYSGKWVICHGSGKGQYRCQALGEMPMFLPYEIYLSRVSPRMVKCSKGAGKKADVTIKRDAVGYEASNVAGVYIYQPDGSYLECTTAD